MRITCRHRILVIPFFNSKNVFPVHNIRWNFKYEKKSAWEGTILLRKSYVRWSSVEIFLFFFFQSFNLSAMSSRSWKLCNNCYFTKRGSKKIAEKSFCVHYGALKEVQLPNEVFQIIELGCQSKYHFSTNNSDQFVSKSFSRNEIYLNVYFFSTKITYD